VQGKEYQARLAGEHRIYDPCEDLEEHLPPIFHYWSTQHISPLLAPLGFQSPSEMFRQFVAKQAATAPQAIRCVSIGAGNCKLEIDLVTHLREQGRSVLIDCLDLSEATLDRGRALAQQSNVEDSLQFIQADFNCWKPAEEYDIVIANQSLHHALNLEHLFAEVRRCLKPDGRFVISDMIGRNGHQLWPEALRIIREFWSRLPPSHRYNHQLQRYEEQFENWDYSRDGFEAIRSQDILPLLTEMFHFELFAAFGNLIYPFVERSFGPNFDPASQWDRCFIDDVHARDQLEIRSGRLKPAHMLAVVRNHPNASLQFVEPLRPEYCIRSQEASGDEPVDDEPAYQWGLWPHDPRTELEIACRRLAETELKLREVRGELDKVSALAAHFDAERNERTAWALRLNEELRETTAPVQSLMRELEERTQWALGFEKELKERTDWAMQLNRDLEESFVRCRELVAEVEERTAWALQLDQQLKDRTEWAIRLQSELDELRRRVPNGLRQHIAMWIRERLQRRGPRASG